MEVFYFMQEMENQRSNTGETQPRKTLLSVQEDADGMYVSLGSKVINFVKSLFSREERSLGETKQTVQPAKPPTS